jgi:uncharacterized protein
MAKRRAAGKQQGKRAQQPAQVIPLHRDEVRADSYVSALTGIGRAGFDKRTSYEYERDPLELEQLEELYRGSAMAARIVETVPDEALRPGWELAIEGERELAEEVVALLDELDADAQIHQAWCAARYAGGGALLLGADDGRTAQPWRPFEVERVKEGGLGWLTVLTPRELHPDRYYSNPNAKRYGDVEVFRVRQTYSDNYAGPPSRAPRLHESRLIRFPGVPLPRRFLRDTKGWGDSVLQRCHAVIQDFETSWSGAALLLQDFAQAIFKIKGLAELVAGGPDGDATVMKRAELVGLSRSVAKAVLMDSEEDFRREVTPLGGLPEMLMQLALHLSAVAKIPAMILMGQSPAGLNATGAGDLRWWYDSIDAARKRVLRPALNQLVRVAFRSLGAAEPDNWTVRFPALWEPTAAEKSTMRKTDAEADSIRIADGVVTPEEVALSRYGGDQYGTELVIDVDARRGLQPQPPVEGEEEEETQEPAPEQDPEAVDPRTALAGGQVSGMLEIIRDVAAGRIPRSTGVQLLHAAYPLGLEDAERIMGDVGAGFVPSPAAPPAGTGAQPPGDASSAQGEQEEGQDGTAGTRADDAPEAGQAGASGSVTP